MPITVKYMKAIFSFVALACLVNTISEAAIVMTGTRVIFPSNQNEKTIQLQNKDNIANIIQVWLDSGNEASKPDTADAPFIANPQIFKIAPNQGQMVRIIYTGQKTDQPQDRESIFYLNFSEIPAIKNTNVDKNKLMVVFKNRVKVFYRPERLPFPSHEITQHIQYKFIGSNGNQKISISNNSPYYANISEANLLIQSTKILLKKNSMFHPFSTTEWEIPAKNINPQHARINLSLINDYGIVVSNEIIQVE